jgi:nicotinamidase-related amidase
MKTFQPVASKPYAWPYTGSWSTADTALLLIDFQEQAVRETDAATVVTALAPLVAAWRDVGGRVLHGRRGFDPAVGLPRVLALRNDARPVDKILPRGDAGWQIVDDLASLENEAVIDHPGDNAFLGTDLDFVLKRQGINNLIIAGLRTEGAVHATMRCANDLGLECLLLEDGTLTDLPGAKDAILSVTRFGFALFGTTAPIAAVEAALA